MKAVIIKGNPYYVSRAEKAAYDKFYAEVRSILLDSGFSQVVFDAGEPYTTPPKADLWVGHSRGGDRLRFAPEGTKTLRLDDYENSEAQDRYNRKLTREMRARGYTKLSDFPVEERPVPGKFHRTVTKSMRKALKNSTRSNPASLNVYLPEDLWWDGKSRRVEAFHVSPACDLIDKSGAIQPSGVTRSRTLGGNERSPFMISAYSTESLAENLAYYYVVALLLSKIKTGKTRAAFREELARQIQLYPSTTRASDELFEENYDLDDDEFLNAKVDEALEELEYGGTIEGLRMLNTLAGAPDPIMHSAGWMSAYPNTEEGILSAAQKICIYKVEYTATHFHDISEVRGLFTEFMGDSTISCGGLPQLPSEDFEELTPDADMMGNEDTFRALVLLGEDFAEKVSLEVKYNKLETEFFTDNYSLLRKIEGELDVKPSLIEELDDGYQVGDVRFPTSVVFDPEEVVSYNAPECEMRFFTRGIPVVKKGAQMSLLATNYAVKIKTAAEIFQEVQQRYIDRGYTFAKGEFGLFYIPEKGW